MIIDVKDIDIQMKILLRQLILSLILVPMVGYAESLDWLPTSPVSFYELASAHDLSSEPYDTRYSLSLDSLETTPALDRPRPYGFGRELNDTSPVDYPGLRRDTAYFFGYQFFIVGLLYVMPEEVSSWSEEDKEEYNFSKWWDNVTGPRWDPDEWYLNYILHPYWGMTYYTRGRERGLTEMGAFWFSFTLSSIYEFGLEALFEPVSVQDVIFTPTLGAWLGWYLEDTRRSIKQQSSFSTWDKTILIATDPLGTLNTMVDKLFGVGVESELALRTFYQSPKLLESGVALGNDPHSAHTDPVVRDYIGVQLTLHF
ncbi:MAG: hypothetical protein B6D82_14185 [gamma proteobacterium symbiont of Ctena orbiculata]|nr:MAG: hypothetical protein DBP00_12660 [gamma proteobacterium symbiont of Ctena orbiculata]PVV09335.1 MAG: hypothetical protein B6D82_14185 [gamma proteobacterium symbiont of Ctena orbiculata]